MDVFGINMDAIIIECHTANLIIGFPSSTEMLKGTNKTLGYWRAKGGLFSLLGNAKLKKQSLYSKKSFAF